MFKRLLGLAGALACSAGCYRSHTIMVLPHTAGHTWTGTGRLTDRSHRPYAVGLAGPEMLWSPDLSRTTTLSASLTPSLYPDGAPYVLTGIAQTSVLSDGFNTWVHAQPTGRDNDLSLFVSSEPSLISEYDPVLPVPSTGVIEDGANFEIKKICDIAAIDHTEDQDGRLYMSVIACRGTDCAGGLVEVASNVAAPTRQWWVRDGQATLRGRSGHFAAECMPIATTGRDQFATNYVALASPSSDELYVYRAGAINAGPVATVALHAGYQPKDVVFARTSESPVYVSVLRKSATDAVIEAYMLSSDHRLTGPLAPQGVALSTQFIESPGFVAGTNLRDMYIFGSGDSERRQYDLTGYRP